MLDANQAVLSFVMLQDDAPLPSNRYTHMADMLQPDNAPETFQAWKAQMQQLVQLRLLQVQQASSK